jgi:putative membrane protein
MAIEYFLAILLGIAAGIFTGITPGIHINLIASIALAISFHFDPLFLCIFIVAMSITHTFLDFIPSVFLGAPEDDGNALSVLPGHRLLIKGYGYGAVKLTLIGSMYGLLLAIAILPFYMFAVKNAFGIIKASVPFVILAASLFLILKEGKKLVAAFVFLLSGILGILTFNLKPLSQPLLPLFTSLFGLPLLFLSIKNKTKIKKQKIVEIKLKRKEKVRPLLAGLLASSLVSLYPAIGSGQAAIIGSEILGSLNTNEFLILVGSINTIVMLFSFVTAYAIGKARSGSAAAVAEILKEFSLDAVILFVIVAVASGLLSFFICKAIAKIIAKKICGINYTKLCLAVILFVLVVNIFVSGIWSVFVLVSGLFIGLITNISGIRKIHMMGSLVIPTLLFYI